MNQTTRQQTAGKLRIITPCAKHIYFWGRIVLGEVE